MVSARRPNSRLSSPRRERRHFAVTGSNVDRCSVVHARGELDLAGGDQFVRRVSKKVALRWSSTWPN